MPTSKTTKPEKTLKSEKSSSYKNLENRDLSWIKFNERVLEEAEDRQNPVFERLQFLSIYHSNLNEFMMVRVGNLQDTLLLKKDAVDSLSGMSTEEQLRAIYRDVRRLVPRTVQAMQDILHELEEHGIFYKDCTHLTKYEERFLMRYFEHNVHPLLSPHIIDKHHPFPFLQSGIVYVAVLLKNKSGSVNLGIIPANGYFERLLYMHSKFVKFTLIEDIIYLYASKIFPKHKVLAKCIFSITRNADIDADEAFLDFNMSHRDVMEIMVKKRKKLQPVRLNISREQNADIVKLLSKHTNLLPEQIFYSDTPCMLDFVGSLRDKLSCSGFTKVFYPPLVPQVTAKLDTSKPLLAQVQKKDLLLSYPFEDIRIFIRLLEEAANSPRVQSIKITLYRVARNSKVVDALIHAAENGKEVIAMVELRARFDEENNIDWSKRLQEAGVTIVYGIENYKVHSKLLLITMVSKNKVSFLTQVGTGNYNESTSRLYTDLSYLTAKEEVALNAQNVFQNLCTNNLVEDSPLLLVSPLVLKPFVLKKIDEEIAVAKEGGEAQLTFKVNSLNDPDIIKRLVAASAAGVKIQLIVRGICCLVVSRSGPTKNIEICSIVGRYLEHSRIYRFGTPERQSLYISSADFMSRNTDRRVEVAVPVTDADAVSELNMILELSLKDNVKARYQNGKGKYKKRDRAEGELPCDSQLELYRRSYHAADSPLPEFLKK